MLPGVARRLKAHIYLAAACLISFLAGYFLFGGYLHRQIDEHNFIIAEWDDAPVVVICPSSQISESRVRIATEYWSMKGYNFAFIESSNTKKICKNKFLYGFIFIRGDEGKLSGDSIGVTSRQALGTKILSASIEIDNKHRLLGKLVEHELGHALGFGHAKIGGHIMHPILDHSGYDFYIPD